MFHESPAEAWALRYGSSAPDLGDLGALLNHRSVRKFSDEPIPEGTVAGLVAAAQSAATSSMLQTWSVVSVQDSERRLAIAKLCGGQRQIERAAWFFAWCLDLHRVKTLAERAGLSTEAVGLMEMFTVGAVDTALAAERFVVAAERLGLGTCYIGALRNHPEAVRDLLGLPAGTAGLFGLCLGVPSEEAKAAIKPRLGQDAVWHREQYNVSVDVSDFDARYLQFSLEQGMDDVPWSRKMADRIQRENLSGREAWGDFLRSQGLAIE